MKKEIAHLLADAITSGHYQRTRGTNRRVDPMTKANSFCIGGVLINLFAQAHPELAAKETDPRMFMRHSYSLPDAVVSWAGMYSTWLDAANGSITINGHHFGGLQHANDKKTTDMATDPYTVSWDDMATWLRADENYKLV